MVVTPFEFEKSGECSNSVRLGLIVTSFHSNLICLLVYATLAKGCVDIGFEISNQLHFVWRGHKLERKLRMLGKEQVRTR